MQGKPFTLLGINSDGAARLKATIAKEHMTWPSFADGSTEGPIATAWGVHSWPSIYVLDAKGVIRNIDLRGEQLDKAVDELMKETQK
jgi:peroxiredoxin